MAASAATAAASIVMLILLVHSGVGLHDKETIGYGAARLWRMEFDVRMRRLAGAAG